MIVPRLSSAEICLSRLARQAGLDCLCYSAGSARQSQLAAQGPALRCRSAPPLIMTATLPQANVRPGVDSAQHKCAVCDKEIVDGTCFCRMPREEKPTVLLCSPRCAHFYSITCIRRRMAKGMTVLAASGACIS